MVEPLINWNPTRLRAIAIVLISLGIGTIAANSLIDWGFDKRATTVLVTAVIVITYQFHQENPIFMKIISLLSALIAIIVPFVVCSYAFKIMVSE